MFAIPDVSSNMTCISFENRQLRFILSQRQSSVVWYCFQKEIEADFILHIFEEIKTLLRQNAPLSSILALGEIARQQIFPEDLSLDKLHDKEMLIVMAGHEYHFDLLAEGDRFLGLQYYMGRCLLWDTGNLRKETQANTEANRALLIINPTEDLTAAEAEGNTISDLLENAGVQVDILFGRYASLRDVSMRLNSRAYGLIHYCGHVVQNENGSALALANGKMLSAAIIANLKIGAKLVFINGCSSNVSAFDTLEGVGRMGIVDALAKTGVSNIIGTITDISDTLSKEFSVSFYQTFLSGTAIGESVARTRQKFAETGRTSALAYTLYGNPKTHFEIHAAHSEKNENAAPKEEKPAGAAPPKKPDGGNEPMKNTEAIPRKKLGEKVMSAFLLSTVVFSDQVVSTYSFAVCLAMLSNNKFSYLVSEANGNIPALPDEYKRHIEMSKVDSFPQELLSPNMLKATLAVLNSGPEALDVALMRELLSHKEYSLHSVFDYLGVDMAFVKEKI